ncbi:MAG TPA: DNA-binding domain-containing protein [Caldimonas sp.]|jgi:hypothetical protein
MLSLHDTQALVTDALLHGEGARSASALLRDGRGISPERRLQVYRNNLFASLGAALQAVYPVTARLIGEALFRQLARGYIVKHPSRSGDLHGFGARLPAFVDRQSSLDALPYLGDVAALEWAHHEVYHEADEEVLDAATMARVPGDAQGRIRLHLQLASRFVASPFPVLAIWQANQAGSDDTVRPVSLDDGGVRVLVARSDFEVEFRVLDTGEDRFLRALAEGQPLATAVPAALAADPGFDFAAVLARHVALGSFRAWSLAEGDGGAP